jgi:hypothetical protein
MPPDRQHWLHALDLTTHADKMRSPVKKVYAAAARP